VVFRRSVLICLFLAGCGPPVPVVSEYLWTCLPNSGWVDGTPGQTCYPYMRSPNNHATP